MPFYFIRSNAIFKLNSTDKDKPQGDLMIYILTLLLLSIGVLYLLLKPQTTKTYKPQKSATITTPPPKIISPTPPPLPPPAQVIKENEAAPEDLAEFRLIIKEECEEATLEEIVAITQSMPRPHSMLKSLTKEIDNPEKLFALVKSDPEIAAKVLQTVNSAGFYLTQKITRINHALFYLGTNMVKNIALQCVINTKSPKGDKVLAEALKRVWANSFLASTLAFSFGKNLGLTNTAEVATQALLSYIGNLAILSYKPELATTYLQTPTLFERIQLEQQELGVNSALVGSELARHWELPEELITGIKNSFIPLNLPAIECNLPVDNLRSLVFCYFCCRMAELIITNKIDDIATINWQDPEHREFFYLIGYLYKTNLQDILSLQHRPDFRNEINKLLQKIDFTGESTTRAAAQ